MNRNDMEEIGHNKNLISRIKKRLAEFWEKGKRDVLSNTPEFLSWLIRKRVWGGGSRREGGDHYFFLTLIREQCIRETKFGFIDVNNWSFDTVLDLPGWEEGPVFLTKTLTWRHHFKFSILAEVWKMKSPLFKGERLLSVNINKDKGSNTKP